MKNHTPVLLHTRTRLQAGNRESNQCYFFRNLTSVECGLKGWPQNDKAAGINGPIPNPCQGNRNEIDLMMCLGSSGEKNWWKDFAGCTDGTQCIHQALQKHKELTGKDFNFFE